MKQHSFALTTLLLAGLAITGCQKPPAEDIASAQKALAAVEESAAKEYAPDALQAASDAFDAANAEIKAQNEGFAMSRNYDHAKELLAQAVEQADVAAKAAATAKAQAQSDAEAASAALGASFEAATADLNALGGCRKKPKGFAADLEALTGRLDALHAEMMPIQDAIAAESFADAIASAGTLSASLSALSTDLQSARQKLGC